MRSKRGNILESLDYEPLPDKYEAMSRGCFTTALATFLLNGKLDISILALCDSYSRLFVREEGERYDKESGMYGVYANEGNDALARLGFVCNTQKKFVNPSIIPQNCLITVTERRIGVDLQHIVAILDHTIVDFYDFREDYPKFTWISDINEYKGGEYPLIKRKVKNRLVKEINIVLEDYHCN